MAAEFLSTFLAKFDDDTMKQQILSPTAPTPSPQKRTKKRSRPTSTTSSAFTIDNRLVQLWGSSRGNHRYHLAKSLISLLERKGDDALTVNSGGSVSAMLLFKRMSALVKMCNLKMETASSVASSMDERGLLDSLSVMYSLVALPVHGNDFATEFVDTNLVVYRCFCVSPKVSDAAVRLLEIVYQKTSFVNVFKSPSQLSSYCGAVGDITESAVLEVMLRMLLDNGNVNGIPAHDGIGRRAISEIQKMLFHRLPRVRTAVSRVIVSDEMCLPSKQQIPHSELIRSGVLILKSHLFEKPQIAAGYTMLMAVLKSHKEMSSSTTETTTKTKKTLTPPLPHQCDPLLEAIQIRDGIIGLLNNPKAPSNRAMFESRDYTTNMLRSSQEAALKLLNFIAVSPLGHLLDHKVIICEVLGSMTNKQDYVVQVESLKLLRTLLKRKETFPVSIGLLSLLMGDKVYKKLNSLHNFLLRGEGTNNNLDASSTATSTKSNPLEKRGKKNWLKAISSTTSHVESIGGTKIVSTEAAMRHFLTTDLDTDTVSSLHIGLRRMGWMDQGAVGGPSVDATTSSLIVGNKLRGKMLARRRKKKQPSRAEGGDGTKKGSVGGFLQPGGSRYHDEGVIHVPCVKMKMKMKMKISSKGVQRGGESNQGSTTRKFGAGGNVRSRLKMAQLHNRATKKNSIGSIGMIAQMVTSEVGRISTISKPKPMVTHIKYRPLGFGSFDEEKINKDNTSSSSSEQQDAESMLESVTKDEQSFTQSCANRNVITFNSRMSAGADRVMSIEADEASAVAANLLSQVQIAEVREDSDAAKIAAKLGRGATDSSQKKIRYQKGSAMHSAQRVELALQLLSARNQRHKRAVKISVTVSDPESEGNGSNGKTGRSGWRELLGDESHDNPVARAMLSGWCCGFDLELQEKMKRKRSRR